MLSWDSWKRAEKNHSYQAAGEVSGLISSLCMHKRLLTPRTVACHTPLSLGIIPSKNNGVGCHFLLQGIFLTQGSNPHLLQCLHQQADSLHWATREAVFLSSSSFFFFFKSLIFNLAVSDVSYSMGTLSCGMWDLIPWPGIEPGLPALGTQSLSHWAHPDGNPLQYSCLENPMDRGAWQATVFGVARVGHDWAAKHTNTREVPKALYLDSNIPQWLHRFTFSPTV